MNHVRTLLGNEQLYQFSWVLNIFRFILIIVQQDTTQSSLPIIPKVHSTCFGCQLRPSSGVHKILITASGTDHNFCAPTSKLV